MLRRIADSLIYYFKIWTESAEKYFSDKKLDYIFIHQIILYAEHSTSI